MSKKEDLEQVRLEDQHDWTPFTEEMVICNKCGSVCNEIDAPEDEWYGKCVPDEILVGGE